MDAYLTNNIGVQQSDRLVINHDLFGDTGVISAEDDFTFEQRANILISKMTMEHPDIVPYLCNKFIPLLKEGVVNVVRDSVFTTSWTNNNAETLNHVLKQLIDWKLKPLPTFINLISKNIDSQFKDLERTMIGRGKFELATLSTLLAKSKSVGWETSGCKGKNVFKICQVCP